MLALILAVALSGIVIGALGRLVVPGPNPMGLLRTMLVGLGGSIFGGLLGHLVFGWRYRYSYSLGFVLAVGCTAIIVYAIDRPKARS